MKLPPIFTRSAFPAKALRQSYVEVDTENTDSPKELYAQLTYPVMPQEVQGADSPSVDAFGRWRTSGTGQRFDNYLRCTRLQ